MNLTDFRQLKFRREFRISRHQFDANLAVLDIMQRHDGSTKTEQRGLDFRQQSKLLADLATELWRVKQKMTDEQTGETKAEMRRPYRHVSSALDVLSEAGLEIQNHTGQVYKSGLALETLAFQPTPHVARETIIETIRPSIYFQNTQIQQGQVIVGTPKDKE